MANILIDVGHPAHVHMFRNAAHRWQAMGHDVHVSALDREMVIDLLRRHHLPFSVTYQRRGGRTNLLREIPVRTWRTWQIARRYQTDLFVSMANPVVGAVSKLTGKPYLAFGDTEPAYNQLALTMPFLTKILTPQVFYKDAGKKQKRYDGYHELAYLHPDVYTPDASIYEAIGLERETPYSVVRFVAWGATHDVNERGLSSEDKRAIIRELSQHGEIVISTEEETPPEFSHLITEYPQERMPDLLAFAQMYVGEGNTMASEAAVLGTPSIRANTMDMGYCRDLQERGLMFQSVDGDVILAHMRELMAMPNRQAVFDERRQQMLNDSINVTDLITDVGLRFLEES